MDYERAEAYEMPETEPDGFAEAYLHTPVQKIRAYSMAQFDHWTQEPFSSNFRKMLTLEQYRCFARSAGTRASSTLKNLSSRPTSQTQRRSADRKADHVLRLIFLRGTFL